MTWWNVMLWSFFFIGVIFPLGVKFSWFMHKQEPGRYSFVVNMGRFFFSFEDPKIAITSATTIAAEWVIGAIYIDRLPIPLTGYLQELPQHPALACFIGFTAEATAPWLISLVVGAISKRPN